MKVIDWIALALSIVALGLSSWSVWRTVRRRPEPPWVHHHHENGITGPLRV